MAKDPIPDHYILADGEYYETTVGRRRDHMVVEGDRLILTEAVGGASQRVITYLVKECCEKVKNVSPYNTPADDSDPNPAIKLKTEGSSATKRPTRPGSSAIGPVTWLLFERDLGGRSIVNFDKIKDPRPRVFVEATEIVPFEDEANYQDCIESSAWFNKTSAIYLAVGALSITLLIALLFIWMDSGDYDDYDDSDGVDGYTDMEYAAPVEL